MIAKTEAILTVPANYSPEDIARTNNLVNRVLTDYLGDDNFILSSEPPEPGQHEAILIIDEIGVEAVGYWNFAKAVRESLEH